MGQVDSAVAELIPIERIAAGIYIVREQKVMMDSSLAALYGVETKALNQAVRRNRERFPADFMFQLSPEEFEDGLALCALRFHERGVAMLSSVRRNKQAIEANIAISKDVHKAAPSSRQ